MINRQTPFTLRVMLCGIISAWLLLMVPVHAEVAPPEIIDGKWIQGGVIRGMVPVGWRLEFLGHEVPVAADGAFVIGLGRDFVGQARLTAYPPEGGSRVFDYAVESRQYNIQRIEGVPSRTVNPDPADLQRIQRESQLVAAARAEVSSRQDYRAAFQWPLTGPITGVYGSQRVYNGEPRRPHFGVDVYAPVGTEVVAPLGGKVVLAHPDMFFSGGTLMIDHGQGLSSTLMHLSRLLVQQGQEVQQGEPVAQVGATGRATGPHLDWRMNWFDQRVDPQLLVPPMPQAVSEEDKQATVQ